MFGHVVVIQKLLDLEMNFILEMKIHDDPCRRCWPQLVKRSETGGFCFCFPGGRSLTQADIKNSSLFWRPLWAWVSRKDRSDSTYLV